MNVVNRAHLRCCDVATGGREDASRACTRACSDLLPLLAAIAS